jgi:ORF6N domain.
MSFERGSGEVAAAASSREAIERRILLIRGRRVMIDRNLAELYGVETGALVRAMKRNSERFPEDFAFQLSAEEWDNLRCQIGISSEAHGGRRFAPYVFTEQGVAMLSSVLRSKRAVAVNIEIMRTFVALRRVAEVRDALRSKLDELERHFESRLAEHDTQLAQVFSVLRELVTPPPVPKKRAIGFTPSEGE